MRPGGLFLKYAIPLVFLVSGALVVSALVEIYFGYQENKAALSQLQHEKALAAAQRIEQFVHELERQLAWIAQTPWGPRGVSLDQRRLDSLRLLRHAPAVTEVSHFDPSGHEQLRVSRLEMDVVGSNDDYSGDPKFKEAIAHKVYYGPVYFRKESEPYMTVAIAGIGEYAGVVAAEANLKFILDVVSEIEVGESGRAYVVDKQGRLIAHPDISMVLQKTDVSDLPQVVAAFAGTDNGINTATEPIMGRSLRGERVISSNAPLKTLDWHVFVDLPMAEAFAPIYASIQRTLILLLIGLVISGVASLILVRRMVRPIQSLQAGAARIGSGALDHRIDVKGHDELGALADEFNKMAGQLKEYYAGLEQKVEERTRELTEALERQTATSDILRVISSSPTDLQPVLDAVVESAARFCGSNNALLFRLLDGKLFPVANYGDIPVLPGVPLELDTTTVGGACVVNRTTVHVPDLFEIGDEFKGSKQWGLQHGNRAIVATPMLRQGVPVGALMLRRVEPGPFDDRQIELLKTFADQAVIAVENTRLFTELGSRNSELSRALDRMTATSEILRVTSESQTDVQPVFDTIVDRAASLVPESVVALSVLENGAIEFKAFSGDQREGSEGLLSAFPKAPDGSTATSRAILERKVISIEDIASEKNYALGQAASAINFRSAVAVPILREGRALGAISLVRKREGALDAHQEELIRTFADQAAIAIENTRLFKELEARNRDLTEALERQTATSEILRVTTKSQRDVQPVFEAIARNARHLCRGHHAGLFIYDGKLIHCSAMDGVDQKGMALMAKTWPMPPGNASAGARSVATGKTVYIPDVAEDTQYELDEIATEFGYRSIIALPMLRGKDVIGTIIVTGPEPGMFNERQLAALETFADQAVIAIENTRLFNELESRNRDLTESLEQQTATSEILRTISESQTGVQPVFDSIIGNALRLCGANNGLLCTFEEGVVRVGARSTRSNSDELASTLQQVFPSTLDKIPNTTIAKSISTRSPVYEADVTQDPGYPSGKRLAQVVNYRSIVSVPMLREGNPIGTITIAGAEPDMFTNRHIALLETFADQAVIAIENVRLFNELEERLEQQTATSDILRVISKSQTDVQPVFETICANARKLCDASWAVFYIYDGEMLHYAATNDMNHLATQATRQAFPRKPDRGSALGRAILTGSVSYIKDVLKDKDYNLEDLARTARYRSTASVPVLQGDTAIGAISVSSTEPDRFTDRQLGMLQTFADQAVIAIQNTRLFTELQSRTQELARSVEQLRSLSEVGQAVNSTLDLQEVLSTIVKNAVELSGADSGVVFEADEEVDSFQLRATYRMPQQLVDIIRIRPLRGGEGATGRAAVTRQPVQIPELKQAPDYYSGSLQRLSEVAGLRSLLAVPLLREGRVLGSLAVARKIPGEFAPEIVSLLQTFAAQSTLAIQNARLFREIAEKSHELEVASQHKSQFLANMSHELRTPLNAILGYTELISDGIYGEMPEKMGEIMERVQSSGRNLLGLINDVLDLSKIEAGQLELAINDYSFHDIVHSVISSVESLAAEKRLKLVTNLPSDLSVGKGDERRIAQVLMNLVGNAIKFTDKGEVAIDVTESDQNFVVSVRDTGPGVPEEQKETIFEEFQQVDSSSTRKKGGTGLGLAISRRIVELHGGEIWLEATSGKGSIFTFSVPVNALIREVAA